jgi:hypothetical protein
MGNKGTLHFTIGEGFDEIILNIARDHLYDMDVKKSISTFTDGMGMPTDMAIQVIKGELGITTNVKDQVVETCDECDNWFEKEFKKNIKHKLTNLIERYVYSHQDLLQILTNFVEDKVGMNGTKGEVWIDGQYIDLVTYIIGGEIKVKSPVNKIINKAKKIITEIDKYNNLVNFGLNHNDIVFNIINDSLPNKILTHLRQWKIKSLGDIEMELALSINHITNYQYKIAKSYIKDCDNSILQLGNVETYIKTIEELDKRDLTIPVHPYIREIDEKKEIEDIISIIKNRIDDVLKGEHNTVRDLTVEQCNYELNLYNTKLSVLKTKYGETVRNTFKNSYDAYWIDRNGNAYGANGNKAAMLHITMADAICAKLYPDYDSDKSTKLEEEGWVKITDKWVLYSAQYCAIEHGLVEYKFREPITEKQREIICYIMVYGKTTSTFNVGYSGTLITVDKFKTMERELLNELFKL